MNKSAVLSDCGTYRYLLVREWESVLPRAVFIMLNPSTADADHDDPTVRRCIAFAHAWGYGGIEIVNLFGLRATDPSELKRQPDPQGPHANHALEAAIRAQLAVAAWGAHGALGNRGEYVKRLLVEEWGVRLHHLGVDEGRASQASAVSSCRRHPDCVAVS